MSECYPYMVFGNFDPQLYNVVRGNFGKGWQASVYAMDYEGWNQTSNEIHPRQAVVKVFLKRQEDHGYHNQASNEWGAIEAKLVAKLEHPNLVRVLGLEMHEFTVNLYQESCYGNLEDFIRQDLGVNRFDRVLKMWSDCLSALDFLHSRRVPHRGIKPTNVLFNNPTLHDALIFKLADVFAFVSHRNSLFYSERVVPYGVKEFLAPEVIDSVSKGQTMDKDSLMKADIYSMGIVMIYALVMIKPRDGQWTQKIKDDRLIHVNEMIVADPGFRPTASEIKAHVEAQVEANVPKKLISATLSEAKKLQAKDQEKHPLDKTDGHLGMVETLVSMSMANELVEALDCIQTMTNQLSGMTVEMDKMEEELLGRRQ